MAAPKKGMTYFPHLAPKEPSLEKHERGMFSQQACSLKPWLNMVFNRTLLLSLFFRIRKKQLYWSPLGYCFVAITHRAVWKSGSKCAKKKSVYKIVMIFTVLNREWIKYKNTDADMWGFFSSHTSWTQNSTRYQMEKFKRPLLIISNLSHGGGGRSVRTW